MKKDRNILASQVTIKFSNQGKLDKLDIFRKEYAKTVMAFVDVMWNMEDIPSLVNSDISSKIGSSLTSRALQAAGKQASGIVRGTRKKEKQRLWKYNDFVSKREHKKARTLLAYINKHPVGKPSIDQVNPQLDSRFFELKTGCETIFDSWITFNVFGAKEKICIPIKFTKHTKKLEDAGYKLTNSICLNKTSITLTYEKEENTQLVKEGSTIGIDIGIKSLYSISDGRQSKEDIHGHTLETICHKLCRKMKNSNCFKSVQSHRKNHINMILNQLSLNGVKTLRLENIKNLRRGKQTSKYLARWTYADIKSKLESMCKESGVLIQYIDQTYTSQRCSSCGWTRKGNRHGVSFKCKSCGFTTDADLNASVNISLNLPPIGKKKRLQRPNRTGFYWNVVGQEPIVPVVNETKQVLEVF